MSNEVAPSAPHDFHSQTPFVNIPALILLTFIPPASKLKKSISALASNDSRNTAEFLCFILNFIYIFTFIYLRTHGARGSAAIPFSLSSPLFFFFYRSYHSVRIYPFAEFSLKSSLKAWLFYGLFSAFSHSLLNVLFGNKPLLCTRGKKKKPCARWAIHLFPPLSE